MLNKKIFFLIFIFLFCCGQAWGSADTLQPRADGTVLWGQSGCSLGYAYMCVDDSPGSPDGFGTYVSTSIALKEESFYMDSTSVSNIDSVVIRINAEKWGDNVWVSLGYAYYAEGFWTFSPVDSVELTTSWIDYSISSTAMCGGLLWEAQYINSHRWGVRSVLSLDGDAYVTQIFLIVYYAETEEQIYPQRIKIPQLNNGVIR